MNNQEFAAQKGPPFLITSLIIINNKDYVNWLGTTESKVWHRMYRWAVRGEMITKLNVRIYNEFYKKRKVAMYQGQRDIADWLGLKSKSSVSTCIKSMVEKGIIIPHIDKHRGRQITIYELGTHDGSVNKYETLHMHVYFDNLRISKEEKRLGI